MTETTAMTLTVRDIVCHAQLVVMQYQEAGGHRWDGHKPSTKEDELKAELRHLLPELEKAVAEGSVRDYVDAHTTWAVVSMDVRGTYPIFKTRYAHFTRALNLWLKGDKGAMQEELAEILIPLMNENYLGVADNQRGWIYSLREKWTKEFEFSFRLRVPDKATLYRRLSMLMDDNLDTYVNNPERTKKEWAEEYTDIEVGALNLPTLFAFQIFLKKATRYLPPHKSEILNAEVNVAIISHPDINPDLREAILMSQGILAENVADSKPIEEHTAPNRSAKPQVTLPDARKIDYNNCAELLAYGTLAEAMLSTVYNGKRLRQIEATDVTFIDNIGHWYDEMTERLQDIPSHELLSVVKPYATIHRLLNALPLSDSFYERTYTKIFRDIERGDKRINQAEFLMMLAPWLAERPRVGMKKYTDWVADKLKEWHGEAHSYYKSKDALRPATIAKVQALQTCDLSAIESNQRLYKCILTLRYETFFEQMDNYRVDTLQALSSLLRACPDDFPNLNIPTTQNRLNTLLAWSPKLHPLLRDTYRLFNS